MFALLNHSCPHSLNNILLLLFSQTLNIYLLNDLIKRKFQLPKIIFFFSQPYDTSTSSHQIFYFSCNQNASLWNIVFVCICQIRSIPGLHLINDFPNCTMLYLCLQHLMYLMFVSVVVVSTEHSAVALTEFKPLGLWIQNFFAGTFPSHSHHKFKCSLVPSISWQGKKGHHSFHLAWNKST